MELNPYFSDGDEKKKYFTVSFDFKHDYRDYHPYPLTGYYFDVTAVKYGLGIFGDETVNFGYMGATFRKFWQIAKRWYVASGVNGKVSSGGRQPYFLVRGLGYERDFIRSYEYYVVDAQHFVIWKNNLKFALLPRKVKDIKFIKSDKFGLVHYAFYLNAFIDLGYSWNNQYYGENDNYLENQLLLGYGLGIDFVTYYDIVIRTEVSINKMNEVGLYLHFRAPI
jgi:hypothetical protein